MPRPASRLLRALLAGARAYAAPTAAQAEAAARAARRSKHHAPPQLNADTAAGREFFSRCNRPAPVVAAGPLTTPHLLNAALLQAATGSEVLRTLFENKNVANEVNASTAWHRLATLARSPGPVLLPSDEEALAQLEALTERALPRFRAQGLSNTLWAQAVLRSRSGRQPFSHGSPLGRDKTLSSYGRSVTLLPALCRAASSLLEEGELSRRGGAAEPQALSNIAWAAATLLPSDPSLCLPLVASALRASQSILPSFSPQGVSNLLWASAICAPRKEWSAFAGGSGAGSILTPLADQASRLMTHSPDSMTAIDLSCCAWAFAELRFHPSRRALDALDSRLATDGGRFNAQCFANALWAFAVFQQTPVATLASFKSAAQAAARANALPDVDVASAVWSLAVVEGTAARGGFLYDAMWRRCTTLDVVQMNPALLRSIFQARLLVDAAGLATPPLPPALTEAMEIAWRSSVSFTVQSDLQTAVFDCVRSMRLPPGSTLSQEVTTEDGLFSIDIALRVPVSSSASHSGEEQHRIAIEVDGPPHFSGNSRTRLGRTEARDVLLRARGWQVLSVPYFEWNAQRSAGERRRWLGNLLMGLKGGKGGGGPLFSLGPHLADA